MFVQQLAALLLMRVPCTGAVLHVFVDPLAGFGGASVGAGGHASPPQFATVHAAAEHVRGLLARHGEALQANLVTLRRSPPTLALRFARPATFGLVQVDVVVDLAPGIHHVGAGPLRLGPSDGAPSPHRAASLPHSAPSPSPRHLAIGVRCGSGGPRSGGRGGRRVLWRSADPSSPAVLSGAVAVTGWKPHPTKPGALAAPLPANISKGSPLRQFWVAEARADRPKVFGHGRQPGDNRLGHCLNLTNVTSTEMYPTGSAHYCNPLALCPHSPPTCFPPPPCFQTPLPNTLRKPARSEFDFTWENATDPSKWPNPGDVEFVYTSCDAINCWIEPRCTVDSVRGQVVSLKQDGNSSCYHRLYYYAQCFNDGHGPGRQGYRGMNPTTLENVATNWTQPGEFYYDRAAARIGYIPRQGEDVHTLEATATTATVDQLLVVNATQGLAWQGVIFEYSTLLGPSGNKGYIDTQSAYQCQDGEPHSNVHVIRSTNITFSGCTFRHLGGVYALGAD
eukprot:gene11234-2042_t